MTQKCGVLFSGGLDSSLTACTMIEKGYYVDLIHFNQGVLLSNNLPTVRYSELKRVYGDYVNSYVIENIGGLFRKLALVTLEKDIQKYKVNMICVGCKLAMHIRSIIYCRKNNISIMADGSNARQSKYGEQSSTALSFFRELYGEYDVDYINPIYNLSKPEIKYELLDREITIQPLEDTCLFSHTFSTASEEAIKQYLDERKLIAMEVIERSLSI